MRPLEIAITRMTAMLNHDPYTETDIFDPLPAYNRGFDQGLRMARTISEMVDLETKE